jgi:hypothetical protein
LPQKHAEEFSSVLDAIIEHALTRQACKTVMAAKLNDNYNLANPKFIVSCDSERGGTQNLVYWQSDVTNDFTDVLYEVALPEQSNGGAGQENSGLSKEQQLAVTSDCKLALRGYLKHELPRIESHQVTIRQANPEQIFAFIDYQEENASFATNYTATCLITAGNEVRLTVFAH